MITTAKDVLTAEVTVNAPLEQVWEFFTDPKHIVHWNSASPEWCTPRAENDLRPGGKFNWRMEARDGSMGFDFEGEFNKVEPHRIIGYTLADGREVQVNFARDGERTIITENFEPENTHSIEMQKEGWQAILNNFRRYTEVSGRMDLMHFEIFINAPVEKVYQTMLDNQKYSEWTAVFNPTSRFEGSWDKGSEIRFIGTDQDGNQEGMLGRIRENIPNKYISIEYFGIVQQGKDITSGPDLERWAGGLEDYTFTESNGGTLLSIDVDTNREFKSYFEETWPKALDKIKEMCEN